jgi:SAM-dependent methyltransferase
MPASWVLEVQMTAAVPTGSESTRFSPGPSTAMLGGAGWTQVEPGGRGAARLGRWLRRLAARSSAACRVRRARLFVERLQPTEDDRILDLGGGSGGHIAEIVPYRSNVTIGELDAEALRRAAQTYGFGGLHVDGGETFPAVDGEYDVVFCSSVIEHVTGPKEIAYHTEDAAQFAASARAAQANFAAEIRRVAKRYFVQTPYKYFPIEQHSFLPFFVVLLPRRWQVRLMRFLSAHGWLKPVYPDFRLLTVKEMRALFPDAEIVLERYCGFVKSIVAIRA